MVWYGMMVVCGGDNGGGCGEVMVMMMMMMIALVLYNTRVPTSLSLTYCQKFRRTQSFVFCYNDPFEAPSYTVTTIPLEHTLSSCVVSL